MKKFINIIFPRPATYDLTNPKHVKEISKNNSRYYYYKKLYLILMERKNFWTYYKNHFFEDIVDVTIGEDLKIIRRGVMVGDKYPYIFKKYPSGNSYEFLYLFYYESLLYKREKEWTLYRCLLDIPFGAYKITVRIKNVKSEYFSLIYEENIDLNPDPDFQQEAIVMPRCFTVYTLSLEILNVVNKRVIHELVYEPPYVKESGVEKKLNYCGRDAYIMVVLKPFEADFPKDGTLRTMVSSQREYKQKKKSLLDVIKRENLQRIKHRRELVNSIPRSDKKRFHSSSNENISNRINTIENNDAYIFTNIEKIIDSNPKNKNTQIEIEKFLYNQGKHILQDVNILGVNINYLNNNIKKYCFQKAELIKKYLTKIRYNTKKKDLESYINSKSINKKNTYYTLKILSKMNINDIINIMLYVFLKIVTYNNISSDDGLYNGSTQNNILLGKLLVNKYISAIKDKDMYYSEYVKQFLNADKNNSMIFKDDFYLHLGSKLTEIMIESGLFIISSVMYKEHSHSVFKVSDEVHSLLPVNSVILAPLKLPMVVEPKDYGKDKLGGYVLNDIDYADNMITKKIEMKEYSTVLVENIIYYSINNMMKTAFKINKKLLTYLIEYNHEHKLLTMKQEEIYENVDESKLDNKEKKLYQQYLSKKLLQDYVIRIAITYKNVPEIFFPMRMDNRGRLYPTTSYLHYQGCELAKALLLFARPDFIKRSDTVSINYLKAYGATCFGNKLDKKSYAKRLQWVDSNWVDIINYKNKILVNKAENKFLFLAFCLEIERLNNFFNDDSTLEFKTYLPIQLDGTCNGYQHLALLSNEVGLYDKLNLSGKSNNKNKDPSDFYTYMVNQLNIHLEKKSKLTKNKEEKESYNRLINLGLSRSNIKQAIMTKPYNAKDFSVTEYITDTLVIAMKEKYIQNGVTKHKYWYKVSEDMTNKANYKDIYLLAKCINEIIFHNYPRIKALLFYLSNINNIMYRLNLPIIWKLPTGLVVNHQYMSTQKKSTRPYTYLDNVLILKITDNMKVDKIKQENALMPNLVHSLDAVSLTLLYYTFNKSIGRGVVNFYGVHDCYGVTAKYIDVLISQLRGIYIDLYSKEGYVKQFDSYIISYICNTYSINIDLAFNDKKRTLNVNGEIIKFPAIPNIVNTTILNKAYDKLSKANMFIK